METPSVCGVSPSRNEGSSNRNPNASSELCCRPRLPSDSGHRWQRHVRRPESSPGIRSRTPISTNRIVTSVTSRSSVSESFLWTGRGQRLYGPVLQTVRGARRSRSESEPPFGGFIVNSPAASAPGESRSFRCLDEFSIGRRSSFRSGTPAASRRVLMIKLSSSVFGRMRIWFQVSAIRTKLPETLSC